MFQKKILDRKFKINRKKIILKKLKFNHISKNYFNWFKDRQAKLFINSRYESKQQLLDFIKKELKKKNIIYFGIFNNSSRHIGNIKFHDIDLKKKSAWLGIFIGEKKFRSQNIGCNTINLLTDYLYKKLDLSIFYLKVDKKNIPAIKSYKKSGFFIIKNYRKEYLMRMNIFYSKLILGTAQFGNPYGITYKKKNSLNIINTKNILNKCKSNIFTLDTAEDYNINKNIKKRFNKFTINTKISVNLLKKTNKEIISYFNEINKIYKINILFIRNLEYEHSNKNILKKIKLLKQKKLFRKLGLSVYSFGNIKKVYRFLKFDAIQIPLNIFDNRGDKFKNFFVKKDIEVHARSIFLQGCIFLNKNDNIFNNYFKKTKLSEFLDFSKKNKLNKYNLAISHILNKEYVNKIIVGVHNYSQLNQILNFKHYKKIYFLKKFNSTNLKFIDPRRW